MTEHASALTAGLPPFRLEVYLGQWEFAARHHVTASDAQTLTIDELLDLGTESEREEFVRAPLTYTPTWGSPALLEAIAATYARVGPEHVLTFAGAEEAIVLGGPGARRSRRARDRHRAELPVDGDDHARDRRRRRWARAETRGWMGARPRRTARAVASADGPCGRQLPEQSDGRASRPGDVRRAR